MFPLLLTLAQFAQATPADTLLVQQALLRGASDVGQQQSLGWRYLQQMEQWRLYGPAWQLALRLNSCDLLGDALLAQHARADHAGMRARLPQLPAACREPVISRLIRAGVPLEELGIPPQSQRPLDRALTLASRLAPQDSAAMRSGLRAALALIRDDTTEAGFGQAEFWLLQLRRYGADVSAAELVQLAARRSRDLNGARFQVAHTLILNMDTAGARPLLDTLIAATQRDTARQTVMLRSMAYELRGAPGDAQRVTTMRDSLQRLIEREMGNPELGRSFTYGRGQSRFTEGLQQRDVAAMAEGLAIVLQVDDTAHAVTGAAQALSQLMQLRARPHDQPQSDSLQTFAASVLELLWRQAEPLSAPVRDSVRTHLIGLRARYDTAGALRAREFLTTQRFRERALANLIVEIARHDLDRAADMAQPLQDAIARSVAYRPLTERAVAAGQPGRAARFADRTADGEARVSAQLTAGSALLKAGQIEPARAAARAALALLTPRWSCQGCLIVTYPRRPGPPAPPGPSEMEPLFIVYVIRFVLEAGLQDDLVNWAENLESAELRAYAWVALAEGMAFHKNGQFPNYPIH